MSAKKQPSEFARCLVAFLDETDLFKRNGWAEFLGVTESAISQWARDRTIPKPETLRMIVHRIRETDDVPEAVLARFDTMAAKPSLEVSPHGGRMGTSVADYLLAPRVEGIMRQVRRLDPMKQEWFLDRVVDLLAVADENTLPASRQAGLNEADSLLPVAPIDARKNAESASPGFAIPEPALEQISALLLRDPETPRSIVAEFCSSALQQVRRSNRNTPIELLAAMRSNWGREEDWALLRLDNAFCALMVFFLNERDTTVVVKTSVGYRTLPHASSRGDLDLAIKNFTLAKTFYSGYTVNVPEIDMADLGTHERITYAP